jgi:hypothetical protein
MQRSLDQSKLLTSIGCLLSKRAFRLTRSNRCCRRSLNGVVHRLARSLFALTTVGPPEVRRDDTCRAARRCREPFRETSEIARKSTSNPLNTLQKGLIPCIDHDRSHPRARQRPGGNLTPAGGKTNRLKRCRIRKVPIRENRECRTGFEICLHTVKQDSEIVVSDEGIQTDTSEEQGANRFASYRDLRTRFEAEPGKSSAIGDVRFGNGCY